MIRRFEDFEPLKEFEEIITDRTKDVQYYLDTLLKMEEKDVPDNFKRIFTDRCQLAYEEVYSAIDDIMGSVYSLLDYWDDELSNYSARNSGSHHMIHINLDIFAKLIFFYRFTSIINKDIMTQWEKILEESSHVMPKTDHSFLLGNNLFIVKVLMPVSEDILTTLKNNLNARDYNGLREKYVGTLQYVGNLIALIKNAAVTDSENE